MGTIHCFLRAQVENNVDFDPTSSLIPGPSTQNKIERWWRELHHRFETFFKAQLTKLLEDGNYDPSDKIDRYFIFCVLI